MKSIQYRIEYLIYRVFCFFIRISPKKLVAIYATTFGLILYYSRIRRKVVLKNLNIAFHDSVSEKDIHKISRKTYLNAAIVAFEFIYMGRIKPGNLEKYISLEGIEVFEQALSEKKGAIVAGNHFGNWELITAAVSQLVNPLHIFSGMQKNRLVDEEINKIRRRFGTVTIPKSKSAAFQMMKVLKANKPLGMAGDLNVPHDNLFVDFFGKKAVVGQGLATFALKRKAPLIFIWCVRESAFKYRGYLKRIDYILSGDTQVDLENLAQAISNELEDKIRKYPDQYFWFNRRWKTRPPDDPDDIY